MTSNTHHFFNSSSILSFFDRLRPKYSTDFRRQLRTVRDISELLIQHYVPYVHVHARFLCPIHSTPLTSVAYRTRYIKFNMTPLAPGTLAPGPWPLAHLAHLAHLAPWPPGPLAPWPLALAPWPLAPAPWLAPGPWPPLNPCPDFNSRFTVRP